MPNTYVALKSETVSVATPSITFDLTGISGYTDLVLVGSGTIATGLQSIVMRFNGDTGSNYSFTYLIGNGTSAFSGRATNTTFALAGICEPPTISNFLVQIQNYSNSTTYKTVLSRRNLSASFVTSDVSVWRNTAAITSITLFPENSVNFAVGSTFSLYGIAAQSAQVAKATGGTIAYGADGYVYHKFTAPGTFTPSSALTADVLVVGGGGGAGWDTAAGAGAGGVIASSGIAFGTSGYTVTIGAGGTSVSGSNGTNGVDSTIVGTGVSLTAKGGGGSATNGGAGLNGGSGGGGGFNLTAAGTSTQTGGYGNSGGTSASNPGGYPTGGGGGAGAVGGNTSGNTSGAGGIGISGAIVPFVDSMGIITSSGVASGSNYYYAGGGGGGAYGGGGGVRGLGGVGGGGNGTASPNGAAGISGTVNTGGGGGGGAGGGGSAGGGAGGSGIVIIRYPL